MELVIKVTSEELVKPSSQNLNHPPCHNLSFLDQLANPIYMPHLYFYHNTNNLSDKDRSDHIKTSLSQALNLYYPLAGRINDSGDIVLCNDVGACFLEAKASCNMSQVLGNPNPNELTKLLPFEFHEASDVPLKVQLTFFECGGMVLGLGLFHKLCDALSGFTFMKTWAAFARGDADDIVTPCFDLAKMFPPCDLQGYTTAAWISKENVMTRRFVFSNSSIGSLRERFSSQSKEIRATRVEALSVLIWSRFMASTNRAEYKTLMLHPMNLRTRAEPMIPDTVFGNIMTFSFIVADEMSSVNDEAKPLLVEQIRGGIRKIDALRVKKIQEDSEGHVKFRKNQENGETVTVPFSFSSLCRLPVYEADFGWGKPLWFGSAKMGFKNFVAFFDTNKGDGIEAWISLDKDDMSRFETDEEFLRYVSLDTSVIV